jgi:hypothetical protein
MNAEKRITKFSLTQWLCVLTIIGGIIIVADFLLPGTKKANKILEIKKERQQYYNAARNFHYSYRVITIEDQFTVTPDFAKEASVGQKITYKVSPIFQEVNRYAMADQALSSIHSLRLASGLILPLLAMAIMLFVLKFPDRLPIIGFVIQVLMLADLVYLFL